MARRPTFDQEIANLLYAATGSPVQACIQCGTCSATCPAVAFMDHSPRELIAMIRADLKREVLATSAYWNCASCYYCTVKCPRGIDVAYMMYGLKRYSIWKNHQTHGLIGADFSRRFVRMILKHGKSYEPGLAYPYLFRHGFRGLLDEFRTALALFVKGRLPVFPRRIKRRENLRKVIGQIVPVWRLA